MPEVYTLPQVGRGSEINIEKLLSLQPQVVICENQQQVVSRIEDLGIKAVALFPQKLGDVFAEIRTIGQLVGHEERADRLGSHLSQLVNRVKDKTDALQPADLTSLYYVRADLLTTVGDEGHNEIFRICGGKNVVTNAASPYSVKVSLENLYGWDPEVIIIRDRSPLSVADVLSDPRLGNLKAVKSKRVYKEHPGWMEYRLETPFGILEKAKWLQPALFDDLNPETEFQSFVNLLREFNR